MSQDPKQAPPPLPPATPSQPTPAATPQPDSTQADPTPPPPPPTPPPPPFDPSRSTLFSLCFFSFFLINFSIYHNISLAILRFPLVLFQLMELI